MENEDFKIGDIVICLPNFEHGSPYSRKLDQIGGLGNNIVTREDFYIFGGAGYKEGKIITIRNITERMGIKVIWPIEGRGIFSHAVTKYVNRKSRINKFFIK